MKREGKERGKGRGNEEVGVVFGEGKVSWRQGKRRAVGKGRMRDGKTEELSRKKRKREREIRSQETRERGVAMHSRNTPSYPESSKASVK